MPQTIESHRRVDEGWTSAVEDDRLWRRIRPLARSLLEGDAELDAKEVEVREFAAGAVRCRACAVPLPAAKRTPATVVVTIERAPDRLPPIPELRRWFDLTRREAEVALLLAKRRTNREIARDLGVKHFTARRHTEKVLMKLGLRSRTEVESVLRTRAARAGWYRR